MNRIIALLAAMLLAVASGVGAAAASDSDDKKVTICHAAGLDGTTKYVELTLAKSAVFKDQGGHFFENGTPQAGHEDDYIGACKPPMPDKPLPPDPTVVSSDAVDCVARKVTTTTTTTTNEYVYDAASNTYVLGTPVSTDVVTFRDATEQECPTPVVTLTPVPPIEPSVETPVEVAPPVEVPEATKTAKPREAPKATPKKSPKAAPKVTSPKTTSVATGTPGSGRKTLPHTGLVSDSLPFLGVGLLLLGILIYGAGNLAPRRK